MASPLFRKVSGSGSGSETAGSSFAKTTLLTPMSSGTATPITATSIAATEPTILRAPVHKSGSVIPTPDGGMITVRPYRSNSTNQMKALVTFTPRPSGLDRFNEKASGDQFRGFYSLFWIGEFGVVLERSEVAFVLCFDPAICPGALSVTVWDGYTRSKTKTKPSPGPGPGPNPGRTMKHSAVVAHISFPHIPSS